MLDAAEALLREGGVAAVTLSGVARAVGVSHQTVSYHFSSSSGLLERTMARALRSFNDQVIDAFDDGSANLPELMERFGAMLGDEGHAHALAALIAAGYTPGDWAGTQVSIVEAFTSWAGTSVDTVQARRAVELILAYSLGMAVFGDHLRAALGLAAPDPRYDREMSEWIAGLVAEGGEPAGGA